MKFLISISVLLMANAFAAGHGKEKQHEDRRFFGPLFDSSLAEKMANKSCAGDAAFDKYNWAGDDLFEIETCLDGAEKGTQYIEFQMTDGDYCVFPQIYVTGGWVRPDFELDMYDIGLSRRGYDFDEDKYCGTKGRDKLKIEGGSEVVLVTGARVVTPYFKCLDYNLKAKTDPSKFAGLAVKQCAKFYEKYLNTRVFLRTY